MRIIPFLQLHPELPSLLSLQSEVAVVLSSDALTQSSQVAISASAQLFLVDSSPTPKIEQDWSNLYTFVIICLFKFI